MGFPSPIVTSVSQEILFLSETIAVEAARSRVLLLKAMSLFSEFIEPVSFNYLNLIQIQMYPIYFTLFQSI